MRSLSRQPQTVVFLGPSLSLTEARQVLRADFMPPVRRGDLGRLSESVSHVLIIDGVFGQQLSVSPKEILALLHAGVVVLGASSMGALRAVELNPYGMLGCGWVYRAYRTGYIDADDEVALMFNPVSLEALTVPLVNVRYWADTLSRRNAIGNGERRIILKAARQIFYADRFPDHLLKALKAALGADRIQRLLQLSQGTILDIKALDAREALVTMNDLVRPSP